MGPPAKGVFVMSLDDIASRKFHRNKVILKIDHGIPEFKNSEMSWPIFGAFQELQIKMIYSYQ